MAFPSLLPIWIPWGLLKWLRFSVSSPFSLPSISTTASVSGKSLPARIRTVLRWATSDAMPQAGLTLSPQHLAASSGTGSADFEQLEQILEAIPQVKYICLDVANGYSEHFVEFVKDVRKRFPQHTIMAGNVVTGEMVEELILSGADIIKVGIGPGSVCTTRKKTGVGYPQLSAVMECADAAHGLRGHIISDGGCSCPGDVAKAFGAGADFVMLGGMLAGHSESGGELIERDGKKYKLFYGMSSEMAMKKYSGGVAEYRASEGKTVEVPFKGDVEHTIRDILGGIRSTCTYVGAAKLKELSRRTTFIRVTQQVNPIFSDSR
ncbi:GMP reductase 2 isoform X2 [Peromyscus californicus insignis]|uniref:GMP reductase 2 isoform X2 n=1 Tax=Peromyscus californicus insignis TaxID=564181 RepID=UPI0022A71863|nr:GMP reductase 2 isoform X2 [Peromyscus californicus insignis]XP_052589129.1 GMP reductase 2 isoform X2 [Peromyscus californicus insignis]